MKTKANSPWTRKRMAATGHFIGMLVLSFLLGIVPFVQVTPAQQAPLPVTNTWTPLGPSPIFANGSAHLQPVSGRVSSLALSEKQGITTLFLGSAGGGVWKSTDNGASWTPLTDNQVTLATGSIAIDPKNSKVIYDGTGEQHFSIDSRFGQGVLKSTDGGSTWTLLGADVFAGQHIGRIAVDPNNPTHVWVAADNGLFLSKDSGKSWTRMWGSDMWAFGHIERPADIYIDANSKGTLYMAVEGSGIYKSTDGGNNFNLLGITSDNSGLPNWSPDISSDMMFNASLGIVEGGPKGADTIYTAYTDLNGELMGFYVSHDGGNLWSKLQNVPPYFDTHYSETGTYDPNNLNGHGWYDNVIAVDPTNPQHILVGGMTLLETHDGGMTWKVVNPLWNPGTTDVFIPPDQHAIVFDSAGDAFVGNDGGVYEETSAGTWLNLNTNLSTALLAPGMSVFRNGDSLLAGAHTEGTSVSRSPNLWVSLLSGDGGYTYVDPTNPQKMFAFSQLGTIEKSTDGGKSWSPAMPNYLDNRMFALNGLVSTHNPSATPFLVTPSTKSSLDEILVGADRVYYSSDEGATYTDISPEWIIMGFVDPISCIAQSPLDPNVIYVGLNSGRVFATFRAGGKYKMDWVEVTPASSRPDPTAKVTSIAINPTNDKDITVTFGGTGYWAPGLNNHVYQTQDVSAATPVWNNITGNLPFSNVDSSTFIGNELWVGTEQGVFEAPDGSSNWSAVGSGLPNVPVTSIVPTSGGKVIVGTYGRGAYEMNLPTTSAARS